jgi:predicted transcriptional regulator
MLALPDDLASRLRCLAERREETIEAAAIWPTGQYLDQLESLDEFDRSAVEALYHYKTTGMHVTSEEVGAWLARLEAGEDDAEPPACHT